MIEIVHPGILASIQDLGRPGYRRIGVGLSGAMDELALKVANIMVGNPSSAAGIETTLGGFELRFTRDTSFAVTGADADVTLDGGAIPCWWAQDARAGQVLKARSPRLGMRTYVAFAGGIDVPEVMGSRSTDLKGGFGGFAGRALAAGDMLDLHEPADASRLKRGFGLSARKASLIPIVSEEATAVRMLPAAEWEVFPPLAREEFLDAHWKVLPDSNRIGYRLDGAALDTGNVKELLSHGILPGTVQVPPSGKPVVQLNDANTCGGYPKLGVVIAADLRKFAQLRLGGLVRFSLVTAGEAVEALKEQQRVLQQIATQCTLARRFVQ
ncbi:biotin-dependent carboxyltransferase family protein [Aquamicrobium sp. LC103]|uniref:5-oxoprolinase subunit C family protein n=1 Tax=Aquamicrobium sp. LC103 TaxID=1120658 RepID=UPI00063EBA3D|nr:biotin-dependent carboxyltransferase family protein [Aquamicrobium sp. LC103]TKT76240.1 biotin-dependent carboxyltransferase family protein [Aquamicrobium sp. LC103]